MDLQVMSIMYDSRRRVNESRVTLYVFALSFLFSLVDLSLSVVLDALLRVLYRQVSTTPATITLVPAFV